MLENTVDIYAPLAVFTLIVAILAIDRILKFVRLFAFRSSCSCVLHVPHIYLFILCNIAVVKEHNIHFCSVIYTVSYKLLMSYIYTFVLRTGTSLKQFFISIASNTCIGNLKDLISKQTVQLESKTQWKCLRD